ncbi:ThuA domain-containing protein [Paraflavitalea speifideaquila]|uniref:ThuA domain-containing protein n=1 Tax=Paraflavitalea speifideaquila TaxID=3076558 RepID=UPI0028E99BA8|nr:ThuA domain-containing protein [Paraflavitalea speifideiaquila]
MINVYQLSTKHCLLPLLPGPVKRPACTEQTAPFKVIGFYTAKSDQAHISYVHEANKWLARVATENNFVYDSTNDWNKLNTSLLAQYQVVLFLDTRPDSAAQRTAFQQYMEKGGGWIGFHFAGFALTPSAYPQNWDWYHDQFLGAGQYKGNTWRPTSAVLRVEGGKHPITQHLPATFRSAPNEWYSWEKDLRKNPAIKILLSIDSTSFPWVQAPSNMKYGIVVITRWPGPIRITGCCM